MAPNAGPHLLPEVAARDARTQERRQVLAWVRPRHKQYDAEIGFHARLWHHLLIRAAALGGSAPACLPGSDSACSPATTSIRLPHRA